MLRITRQSDYGVLLMAELAALGSGERLASRELAERAGVAGPMASKILKALSSAGLLTSTRGAQGGYALSRPPQNITIYELLAALEGPLGFTECSVDTEDGAAPCALEDQCATRPMWRTLSRRVRGLLESISLAEMLNPMPELPTSPGDLPRRNACEALLEPPPSEANPT